MKDNIKIAGNYILLTLTFFLICVSAQKPGETESARQDGGQCFCDKRLKLRLLWGTVTEINAYRKNKDNRMMSGFTLNKIKYQTDNIVRFELKNIDTGNESPASNEFYNVSSSKLKAAVFKVGETYLFEVKTIRPEPPKAESEYNYIEPGSFIKSSADAQTDLEFLKTARSLDIYQELLGSEAADALTAPAMSGKILSLAKPVYPEKAARSKSAEAVKVLVLVDVNGQIIKAKSFCPENQLFAAAAEKAALTSKFTSTIYGGKPVKIKGILTFNFVP